MKVVFEAILTPPKQMGSENRLLCTSLRKAYKKLEKFHAGSEWAAQPMPELATYREKLREFSSHTVQVLNTADEVADFTISVRPVH